MKKISKLGLISVLCLVLVIGGVFATWSYGTNKAVDATGTMGLSLTTVSESVRGTLEVTKTPTITIDDDNNDHIAELVIKGYDDTTNAIEITFTPNANSEDAILEKGIALKITFTEDFGTFKDGDGVDKDVITINKEFTFEASETNKKGDSFVYVITVAQLEEALTLSDIYLPTYTDYEKFHTHLSGKEIKITVKDTTSETAVVN